MYNNGYVVTIRRNSNTLPEKDGKVAIPFNSEYEVRLRNRKRTRAVADVYIDGKMAAEGIVVNGNDVVDLERYVKELDRGNRFKFVPLADGRVTDKGEPENGIIEVQFYPEKEYVQPKITKIIEEHHHNYYDHWRYWEQPWHPKPWWGGTICRSAGDEVYGASNNTIGGLTAGGGSKGLSSGSMSMNYCSAEAKLGNDVPVAAFSAGATVEGSLSSQKFTSTHVDVDRSNCTTIKLQLVGREPEIEVRQAKDAVEFSAALSGSTVYDFCPKCGRKRENGETFCPKDATRLVCHEKRS